MSNITFPKPNEFVETRLSEYASNLSSLIAIEDLQARFYLLSLCLCIDINDAGNLGSRAAR